MNKYDKLATGVGVGTGIAILLSIDTSSPNWWKTLLVALGVGALGYLTNKSDAGKTEKPQ